MATCVWCGKKGFFVLVNNEGFCKNCEDVHMVVKRHLEIIQESQKIVLSSKNINTKLSRLDVIIDNAKSISKYEEKIPGIVSPSTSEIIRVCLSDKKEIILESVYSTVSKHQNKAELAVTLKSKINELNKILLKLNEAKSILGEYPQKLIIIERSIRSEIHKIKLNNIIEAAKKAEFKGQVKKAIDQYQEALYFLKTDDVDDSSQKQSIAEVEKKIAELSK